MIASFSVRNIKERFVRSKIIREMKSITSFDDENKDRKNVKYDQEKKSHALVENDVPILMIESDCVLRRRK